MNLWTRSYGAVKVDITLHPNNLIEMDRIMDLVRTLETPSAGPGEDVPSRENSAEEMDSPAAPSNSEDFDPAELPDSQPGGWTEWPLAVGAKQIFVSVGGDDDNSGRSESEPVKTLAAGIDLLANGTGDQLLLKRGDVFVGQDFGEWSVSGKNADAMMLIGAYGSGSRPMVQPAKESQILVGREGTKCSYVAIADLHFLVPDGHDGSVRPPHIVWRSEGTTFHIEGCLFDGTAMISQRIAGHGPVENVIFRRNVVDAPYAVGGRVHIYWQGVTGGVLEENFLYHLGWKENVVPDDKFTHNAYITSTCTGIVFRRNISMSSSSHGVQLRCGGVMDENVFIDTALQSFGYVLGGSKDNPARDAGVSGSIRDNLFIDPKKIDGADRGVGVQVANVNKTGLVISGNLFLNDVRSGEDNSCVIELDADNGPAGLHEGSIDANIAYNWRSGLVVREANYANVSGVNTDNNDWQDMMGANSMPTYVSILGENYGKFSFSGNIYNRKEGETEVGFRVGSRTRYGDRDFAWWTENVEPTAKEAKENYPDPDRTIETYSTSVGGGGTQEGVIASCLLQQKTFWDEDYTAVGILNYFRAGFGMAPIT